jgi:hypothetical protein
MGLGPETAEETVAANDPLDRFAREPLSPELALVDADLARYSRALLPDPTIEQPRPFSATPSREIREPGPDRPSDIVESARAGRLLRTLLLVLAVVIVAAFALVVFNPDRLADDSVQGQAPIHGSVPAAHPATNERATKPKRAQARPKKQSPAAAAPSTARTGTARAGTAAKPTKAQPIPTRSRPFATHVFVWAAAENATVYKVGFFRQGKQVFEAIVSGTRLELPLRWVYHGRRFRLTPGTYSWIVRPALGPRGHRRYGQPIVNSTWLARR